MEKEFGDFLTFVTLLTWRGDDSTEISVNDRRWWQMTTFTEISAFMSETFTGVNLLLSIQSKLLMPQILDISRSETKIKHSLAELKFLSVPTLTQPPVAEIAFAWNCFLQLLLALRRFLWLVLRLWMLLTSVCMQKQTNHIHSHRGIFHFADFEPKNYGLITCC